MVFHPDDTSRFDNFHVLTTPFTTVHDHPINLNVLYSKNVTSAPNGQPILIRYHGGGLASGASMFPDFFGLWLLELAERHSAIIVSPDYRLLPEANVRDILDDMEASWQFVQTKLASYVETETNGKLKADTSRIMTAGESAGGYLSLVLSLSHPDEIRATTAAYPMIDMKDPWFTDHFEKQLLDVPQLPEGIYTGHVAKIKAQESLASSDAAAKKAIVTSDPRMDRGPLFFTMVQRGLFKDYLDYSTTRQFPVERVGQGERFPKGGVLLWHGTEDSIVPVEQSRKLARKMQETQPQANFSLIEQPGDHGFDAESKIDDPWMKEALDPLVKAWLE